MEPLPGKRIKVSRREPEKSKLKLKPKSRLSKSEWGSSKLGGRSANYLNKGSRVKITLRKKI